MTCFLLPEWWQGFSSSLSIIAKCLCGQVVNFLWTVVRSFSPQIQIFLQLRRTFFSKLSSYALVGTASPWVLGLTLCSSYLYLCPPLPDEFLEAWTWSAVLISIAVDFFLVLPPTPQATEGPGGRTPCLHKASSFMLGGCGEGFTCFPGQGCCLSSSSTSRYLPYTTSQW